MEEICHCPMRHAAKKNIDDDVYMIAEAAICPKIQENVWTELRTS